MRGHPVFIAQHATGTCCRGCLEKWHHINKNKKMDKNDIDYVVNVIMFWIEKKWKISKCFTKKRNISMWYVFLVLLFARIGVSNLHSDYL